jgi:hypothetical protein
MESHLKVTEELLAKTKNKITEVNSIKTWLCKERDRPGVNFFNILRAAFMRKGPQSAKRHR